MSERTESFEAGEPPRISLRLPAGDVRFVRGDPGVVVVRLAGRENTLDRFVVERRGDEIVIEPEPGSRVGRWSGVDAEIRIGDAAEIRARVVAGDVTVNVATVTLSIDSAAGDLTAGVVHGPARAKTASGDIRIEQVEGTLDVVAASGDVRIGSVTGDANVKTAAGDITIAEAKAAVSAHTASGDIEVRNFSGESFTARSLSGDVSLGVPSGRTFSVSFHSMSGDVRTEFPVLADKTDGVARLEVTTISGDIVVRPARG